MCFEEFGNSLCVIARIVRIFGNLCALQVHSYQFFVQAGQRLHSLLVGGGRVRAWHAREQGRHGQGACLYVVRKRVPLLVMLAVQSFLRPKYYMPGMHELGLFFACSCDLCYRAVRNVDCVFCACVFVLVVYIPGIYFVLK